MIPFLRGYPNGAMRVTTIKRGPETELQAKRFLAGGGTYVCEILADGQVNMSAVLLRQGQAVEVECALSENGMGLPGAVDALVAASVRHLPQ